MKIHDQHVHSYYSFDCKQPIEDYLFAVEKLGLDYFVLTDHLDLNFLDENKDIDFDIVEQDKELKELQKKHPTLNILRGIEIGYKPTEIDRINKIINERHFDLINFSLHESDKIDYFVAESFIEKGIDNVLNIYFSRILEMVNNFDDYDVLCHIDYGFKTAYLIDNSISIKKYEDVITQIMKVVIDKNKTFELNTKVQEVLPVEHTKYILDLYKKLGGKNLTISSDAHDVKRFRSSFDKYIPMIKEAGFDHLIYFVNRKKHFYLNPIKNTSSSN